MWQAKTSIILPSPCPLEELVVKKRIDLFSSQDSMPSKCYRLTVIPVALDLYACEEGSESFSEFFSLVSDTGSFMISDAIILMIA